MKDIDINRTLENCFICDDGNLTEAMIYLGDQIGKGLSRLGLADASTPFGAIELMAKEIRDGFNALALAINGLAQEIRGKN